MDSTRTQPRRPSQGPRCETPHRHAFKAFDTAVMLDLWGGRQECQQAAHAAEGACSAYERLFSRTLPDSDVGRLNAAGGAWVAVDVRTLGLMKAALGYCERSEGAFDITVAPAVALWDFKRGVVPDPDALVRAAAHVDWRAVELDEASCRLRLADPQAMVDLGGIAKGWIADRLREQLMDGRFGLSGMIANLGGNVVVGGTKPDGEPWRVGVKDPRDPSRNAAVVPLACGSVVTSGTYERCFRRDGVLCHHVLDPRTGWPVDTDLASATLVCESSLDAEGYSTTVLALGKERGSALVRRCPEIRHACLVGTDGELVLL